MAAQSAASKQERPQGEINAVWARAEGQAKLQEPAVAGREEQGAELSSVPVRLDAASRLGPPQLGHELGCHLLV